MSEARLVTRAQLANIVADFHGGSAAHPSRADRQEADAIFAALPAAAPAEGLREAATDVLHAWDAGDIDHDYDRIASAFDSLRAALARHESAGDIEDRIERDLMLPLREVPEP